jgi:uncharacterized protein (DUF4415 family)
MPRGNPRKSTALRLDADLVAQVRSMTDNLTRAIEDGLRLWIKKELAKQKTKTG